MVIKLFHSREDTLSPWHGFILVNHRRVSSMSRTLPHLLCDNEVVNHALANFDRIDERVQAALNKANTRKIHVGSSSAIFCDS